MNHNPIQFKKYIITKDNAHNDIVIQKDENDINLKYVYGIKGLVKHEFDKFNLNKEEKKRFIDVTDWLKENHPEFFI